MSRSTPAWLLDCGGGCIAATGLATIMHVVEDADRLFKVPLAPAHCDRALVWRELLLPAADLAKFVTGNPLSTARPVSCVLGWADHDGTSNYGVLLCQSLPRRIAIDDDQQCLPSESDSTRWRGVALGFFMHSNRTTPIIHPASLFRSRSQEWDTHDRKESQRLA